MTDGEGWAVERLGGAIVLEHEDGLMTAATARDLARGLIEAAAEIDGMPALLLTLQDVLGAAERVQIDPGDLLAALMRT